MITLSSSVMRKREGERKGGGRENKRKDENERTGKRGKKGGEIEKLFFYVVMSLV